MKTKLTLLLGALALSGLTTVAVAGPGLDDFALRRQIANSQRASGVADSGAVRYVANPSGKGGTVVATRDASPTTSIALFKSSKPKGAECGSCCAKR